MSVSGKQIFHVIGVLAVAGSAAGTGTLLLLHSSRLAAEEKDRAAIVEAGPRVKTALAHASGKPHNLSVLGEARPYESVTLYAKVSGYLKEMRVDRGQKVASGEVLAVIESPELDQQLAAARADAANRKADADRANVLAPRGVISAADVQHAVQAYAVSKANVESLESSKSYEIVKAPFAGRITARFADPGALVQNAANSQSSSLPLVTLSSIDRLRIFAYLTQTDAELVREGDPVVISLDERPLKVAATITRVAGELDPRTRMMLVEVDLDAKSAPILPGSYVRVSIEVKEPMLVELPATALVLRGTASLVAVVGSDNRVTFRTVEVFDHDGLVVRLRSGVKDGERAALDLGLDVGEGQRVQPEGTDRKPGG